MTTLAAAVIRNAPSLIAPRRTNGQSDAAKSIERLLEENRRHLLESISVRDVAEQALADLEDASQEALTEGWDGHEALPIDPRAYAWAKLFLEALPTTIPRPEIGVDSDGEVSVDWIFGRGFLVSVSIGATGRLTYVALTGKSSLRGTEWLDDGIPSRLTEEIARVKHESPGRTLVDHAASPARTGP